MLGHQSAKQVFAQALDRGIKAWTLSAEVTMTYTANGRPQRLQQRVMLKQPHFERRETIKDGLVEQVTITDYGSRRRLSLDLTNQVARPADLNNSFEVEPETGQVSLTKLDMSVRERLLSLLSGAVEDLGEVEVSSSCGHYGNKNSERYDMKLVGWSIWCEWRV